MPHCDRTNSVKACRVLMSIRNKKRKTQWLKRAGRKAQ